MTDGAWSMTVEPRPLDKMPPNHLLPLVRAVVHNAMAEMNCDMDAIGFATLREHIARRLTETIDQDGWDHSDRVRRASTKLTWGAETDG